jgi:hypothetical protein
MKKTVLTFGLLAGAILSAMMLITMPLIDTIGYDQGMVIGYTTMVVAFLLVFFGIRSYRDNVGGGRIRFGRALAVGALIVVVSSLCYVGTWELIYYKLSPDMSQRIRAAGIEQARAKGGTPAEVEARIAEARRFWDMYQNPAVNAAFTLIEPLPVGLVIALVSAGVLSRKRKREEAELVPVLG